MIPVLTHSLTHSLSLSFSLSLSYVQDIASDVIGQELISREVNNFMNTHGSVREDDLSKLEDYVKSMLIGEEPKKQLIRKNHVDEWSLITKYEAEKTSEEERIRREKLISQRRRIKSELDAQVEDQRRRQSNLKQEEAQWGKQEEKAVDEWKADEQRKKEEKHAAMVRLKKERDEQLAEQAERRAQEVARKKMEEQEARQMVVNEQKAKMREIEAEKVRRATMVRELKNENKVQRELKQKRREDDVQEELRYQKLYANTLDRQENARKEHLAKLKAAQARRELDAQQRGPAKRYMPEEVIDKNHKAYEKAKEEEEAARLKRIQDNHDEMRRVLAEQLKEKEMRKVADAEEESKRVASFLQSLKKEDELEEIRKVKIRQKAMRHKVELEAQIVEEQERKHNESMTDLEKKLNKDILGELRKSNMLL